MWTCHGEPVPNNAEHSSTGYSVRCLSSTSEAYAGGAFAGVCPMMNSFHIDVHCRAGAKGGTTCGVDLCCYGSDYYCYYDGDYRCCLVGTGCTS